MLERLGFPAVGGHRRFVAALGIDALGSGVWLPLSLLYFLHQTDLSLAGLGLALTLANLAVVPFVPLIGRAVDGWGAKPVLQAGNLVQAASFALYPLAHSGVAVAVVVAVSGVGRSMFWGANGPLVTSIAAPGERELWFGFVQAMRNAGYGVGGLVAALALEVGTSAAYDAVVEANAASYVAAFVLMLRVEAGRRSPAAVSQGAPAPSMTGDPQRWVVLRDGPYRWLVAATFLYALTESTLNVAMPVYFVDRLQLPGWVPGAVFTINTVMVGLGQGLTVRAMTGRLRYRVLLTAVGFCAVSFVLLYAADALSVPLGTAVVLVAAVVYTVGELTAGPVTGALNAETAPDHLRGRYLSVMQLAWTAAGTVAPLLYTSLLARGALVTWGGALMLCAAWAAVARRLRVVVPRAALPVTNAAEAG